jgi:hypothetical protein
MHLYKVFVSFGIKIFIDKKGYLVSISGTWRIIVYLYDKVAQTQLISKSK